MPTLSSPPPLSYPVCLPTSLLISRSCTIFFPSLVYRSPLAYFLMVFPLDMIFSFLCIPTYHDFLTPCLFDLRLPLPSTLTFTFNLQPHVFHLRHCITLRLLPLSSPTSLAVYSFLSPLSISLIHQPPHTLFLSLPHSLAHSLTHPACISRSLPTSLSLSTSQTTMNANCEYLPQSYFCLGL